VISRRFLPTLAFLLVTPKVAVSAEEFHLGAQANIALPLGDLKNEINNQKIYGNSGFGGGVHVSFANEERIIKARIDYTEFKNTLINQQLNKFTTTNFGAEWNYYFKKDRTGFFGIAGFGYSSSKTSRDTVTSTRGSSYFSAGFGYTINSRLDIDARYVSSNYSAKNQFPRSTPNLQVGILIKIW